jgi:hypothetical protein
MQLRRAYFAFLQTVVTQGCADVLGSEPVVGNLEPLLASILQGVRAVEESKMQRQCLGILLHLISAWDTQQLPPVAQSHRFLLEHVLPACFEAVLHPAFNCEDAQVRWERGVGKKKEEQCLPRPRCSRVRHRFCRV